MIIAGLLAAIWGERRSADDKNVVRRIIVTVGFIFGRIIFTS